MPHFIPPIELLQPVSVFEREFFAQRAELLIEPGEVSKRVAEMNSFYTSHLAKVTRTVVENHGNNNVDRPEYPRIVGPIKIDSIADDTAAIQEVPFEPTKTEAELNLDEARRAVNEQFIFAA
jgi:hypothetical protein